MCDLKLAFTCTVNLIIEMFRMDLRRESSFVVNILCLT